MAIFVKKLFLYICNVEVVGEILLVSSDYNYRYWLPYDYSANKNSGNNSNVNFQNTSSAPATEKPSSGITLNPEDYEALVDCYVKSPSESIPAAAWGGVTCALMNNPRYIAHPINTCKGYREAGKVFKDVTTQGHALNILWRDPSTNDIMREAYSEMNRVFARGESRIPIFRKKFSKETVESLKKIMEDALATGKASEIAKATEILKSAYVTDTWFGRLFKPLLKIGGFDTPYKTAEEAIANKNSTYITGKLAERMKNISGASFKKALKTHAGIGGILFFFGIEFLSGLSNIRKAKEKDIENKQNGITTNYSRKQIIQTSVKALGSGIGWGVGEAVGVWAFAKYGAKLGSRRFPGIGAIVGGVIGLACGSVGMMLVGRLTKAAAGDDIGSIITANEMMNTPEGQQQILQDVYEKIQKGQASPEAQEAFIKIIEQLQRQQAQNQTTNTQNQNIPS